MAHAFQLAETVCGPSEPVLACLRMQADTKRAKRTESSSEDWFEHAVPQRPASTQGPQQNQGGQQAAAWPSASGSDDLASRTPAQLVSMVAHASSLLHQRQPTLTSAQTAQVQQVHSCLLCRSVSQPAAFATHTGAFQPEPHMVSMSDVMLLVSVTASRPSAERLWN